MGNFIQFELWKDCSNGCKFCFNRGQKDVNKIESLKFVLEKMDSPEMDKYNEIGFIGGEFFDTQLDDNNVKQLFYKLFDKCIDKINNGKLNTIYIATALLFNMEKHLFPLLNYLNQHKVLDKVLLCTSYDLKYRFYTLQRKCIWENNMKLLHKHYPILKLHTETIVSGFFINAILNGEFNITNFCQDFHTNIDFIEPSSGFYYKNKKECMEDIDDFYPTKEQFMKFVQKTIILDKEIDINTFLSPYIRSDKVYYNYNGQRKVIENRRENNMVINSNELNVEYEYGFLDSNEKMIDIVNELRQMVMG